MGKLAFISELPFNGKVGRNHPHMRTEFAQFCALEADHYCYTNISMMRSYEHIILLISKSDVIRNWLLDSPDLVSDLRKNGNKIWFIHEDTAFMLMTQKVLGNIPQYHFKNILLVHNRKNPKKRMYVLNESSEEYIDDNRKRNHWYNSANKFCEQNVYNLFNPNFKSYSWKDVWKTK